MQTFVGINTWNSYCFHNLICTFSVNKWQPFGNPVCKWIDKQSRSVYVAVNNYNWNWLTWLNPKCCTEHNHVQLVVFSQSSSNLGHFDWKLIIIGVNCSLLISLEIINFEAAITFPHGMLNNMSVGIFLYFIGVPVFAHDILRPNVYDFVHSYIGISLNIFMA